MAAVSGPSLNTDGVVFSLDASSPNCWNVGVSTAFVDNVNSHQGFPINDLYHSDGPFVDAGYVEFDGTGDYLSLANTTCYLGANDFTVEAWVYWAGNTALSSVPAIISKWSSSDGPFQFLVNASGFSFQYTKASGGQVTAAGTTAPSANIWYHIAAVKYGSELKLYVNGIAEDTETGATAILNRNDNVQIGHRTWAGPPPAAWDGYISNLRLVSTALYTSNFTPPTKLLTAVPNTVLLTCQGNTIADASSSALSITTEGDAAAKLGSPSYFEFDGTSDFIDFPASADFALGTGNFTIELWMNSGVNSNDTFYRRMYMTDGPTGNASGNLQIAIEPSTGKVNLWENSGDLNLLGTSNITNSTWNHIVAVRLGSTLKIYVNGVEESSTTYSTSVTANSGSPRPRIGNYSGGGGTGDYNGKISNFKIYKGTGLSPKQIRQNYNALKSRFA